MSWPLPSDTRASSAEPIVDDKVGIIRYVDEVSVEAGSPQFFHYYAKACDTSAFAAHPNSVDAGGASIDRETARAKAIGEAVERYCSAIFVRNDLPLSSFELAKFPCVRPEEFALNSGEQYSSRRFPFVPFQRRTRVRWAQAYEPHSGETCYVPAAMVFVPYFYDKANGELPILQPISTGLACHIDPLRSAIAAICEVVERDAFTIAWQARISLPQIAIETLSELNKELVDRLTTSGGHLSLFNLTMDHGIPVIMASLRSAMSDAPALVFAAACSLDPEEAVRKSLEELAHSHRLCLILKAERAAFIAKAGFSNVVDRMGHVGLYSNHSTAHLANFVFASKKRITFSEIHSLCTGVAKSDFRILVERITSVNQRILLINLTTEDVQSAGFSVTRAIIPGFHPLRIGHRIRALGGSRLWQVPQQLGYPGISKRSGDNPAPHPVP